jgi:predicted transcriptional regulator
VKESAHLYANPTAQEGYGIPNFEAIFNLLNVEESEEILEVVAYPNPAITELKFKFPNQAIEMELVVFNILGKRLSSDKVTKLNPTIDISNLPQGLYFVQLKFNNKIKTIKIIKN